MHAMTIHDPIVSDLANDHRRAIDEVNSWRGHCIDCFARIELAVVEALDALEANRFWGEAEAAAAWQSSLSDTERQRRHDALAEIDRAFDGIE